MTQPPTVLDSLLESGIAKWFHARGLEDLELIEVDGEGLFPETITRVDYGNKRIGDMPVLMRVPEPFEKIRAKLDALTFIAKQANVEPKGFTRPQAVELVGEQELDNAETLHILHRALRHHKDPRREYMTVTELQKNHPKRSLQDAWNRLSMLEALTEFRLSEKEFAQPENFWPVIAAVAKKGHLGPLVVTGTLELSDLIVIMARQLDAYRTAELSRQSSESSTSPES